MGCSYPLAPRGPKIPPIVWLRLQLPREVLCALCEKCLPNWDPGVEVNANRLYDHVMQSIIGEG